MTEIFFLLSFTVGDTLLEEALELLTYIVPFIDCAGADGIRCDFNAEFSSPAKLF